MVGQPERMVPRRGRNHPAFLLLGGELHQRIARAAFLEAPGALEILQLAKNAHAGGLGKGN